MINKVFLNQTLRFLEPLDLFSKVTHSNSRYLKLRLGILFSHNIALAELKYPFCLLKIRMLRLFVCNVVATLCQNDTDLVDI